MTSHSRKAQVIAKVAEDYRQRGYEVDVVPRGPRLPEFLGGFQPDLIARSPSESVVVEVKVGTRTSVAERFREVAERVSRQPGWRFSLVFVNPDRPDELSEAEPAPLSMLQERARNADALSQAGQPEAAFLLFFSAVEGILRFLGQRARLPLESLPPSTLIRELYSAGEISRAQFESLMRFLPIRNELVHGFRPKEPLDVEQLRLLVQALLAEAGSGESQLSSRDDI
jgi:hypothetical protein